MAKNKFYKIMSSTAIAALFASTLVAPLSTKAAEHDFYKDGQNQGDIVDIISDNNKFYDLLMNMSAYKYELGNKWYNAAQINTIFDANPGLAQGDLAQKVQESDLVGEEMPVQELTVQSVTATNLTTVEVKFNKELAPEKVLTANFGVDPSTNTITSAKLSDDKKVVTLTLQNPVAAGNSIIVKSGVGLTAAQKVEIVIPEVGAPTIVSGKATDNKNFVLTSDVELTTNTTITTADTITVTATDGTTIADITATNATVNGKEITVTLTATTGLEAGKSYKVTIPAGALSNVYGDTVNAKAIEYTLEIPAALEAPKMTAVEYVKDATGKINAILTFDQDVKDQDPTGTPNKVSGKIVTVDDEFTTHTYTLTDAVAVFYTKDNTDGITANQVLVKDIGEAIESATKLNTVMDTKYSYDFVLNATEVVGTGIGGKENAETKAAANGIDVAAPTLQLDKSVLNSATSITLAFSEAVTYAGNEVTVSGFDAKGQTKATVVAKVEMAVDGKSATLTPKTAGELFKTDDKVTVNYAEGTFKDASENPIAVATTQALTGAIDKAAPVLLTTVFSTTHTLTFTEEVVANATAKFVVNGVEYEYNASAAAGKWNAATNTVVITRADSATFAKGDQISAPSGALSDAAGNDVAAISTTSK